MAATLQTATLAPSSAQEHWDPFSGSFRACFREKQSQRVHVCCYSHSFTQPTLCRQYFSNHSLAVNTRDFLPVLTTVALVVMPLSGIARQRASCLRASERRGEDRKAPHCYLPGTRASRLPIRHSEERQARKHTTSEPAHPRPGPTGKHQRGQGHQAIPGLCEDE